MVVCPCVLPFVAGVVLTSIGVGALGSYLTDNADRLALWIALFMIPAVVIGWLLSRHFRSHHAPGDSPLENVRR